MPPRGKRFKDRKKSLESIEESENVKDFLKGMRGQLDCKRAHQYQK